MQLQNRSSGKSNFLIYRGMNYAALEPSSKPKAGLLYSRPKHIVQPKLEINRPGDQYEQEADAMAERVMRMAPHSITEKPITGLIGASVQRKCAECEEKEKRNPLMRKEESSSGAIHNSNDLSSSLNASKSSGHPLPQRTKQFMENAFSTDFSKVRLHTDSKAAEMSGKINARAFTYGSDIYFNRGEFTEGNAGGQKLLAHELTHVMQQESQIQTKEVQRLGANPGCNVGQTRDIHQAIYDARGWINNMLRKVDAGPNSRDVIGALRRNFGPTYGVAANLSMIVDRIRRVYGLLASMQVNCDSGTDAICVAGNCGFSVAGSLLSTICPLTVTTGGTYLIGSVLHEAFHAAFRNFTVDEYSGWHGAATGTAGYPGRGVEPLLNADSYTSFVIDLS
jgi:hypothetical protein